MFYKLFQDIEKKKPTQDFSVHLMITVEFQYQKPDRNSMKKKPANLP